METEDRFAPFFERVRVLLPDALRREAEAAFDALCADGRIAPPSAKAVAARIRRDRAAG